VSTQAGSLSAGLARRWVVRPLRNERMRRSGAVLLIYALAVAVYAYTAVRSASFRDPAYLTIILRQSVVLGLAAIGQMLVILTGGIDMSIGMIARVVVLIVALNFGGRDSLVIPLIALGLALGAGIGFLNGILITRVHAVPFILTLGTFGILTGIGLAITSSPVGVIPIAYLHIYDAQLGPVPVSVVGIAAAWALTWVAINRTAFGRALFAVGGSPEIARLAAINVRRTQLLAYTLSGLCGAAAGLFVLARNGVGDPSAGTGLEFQSIVAVALGGTSLYGGRGSVVGVLGAVLLLTMISSVFDSLQISVFYQQLVLGAMVLVAVAGYRTPGLRSS